MNAYCKTAALMLAFAAITACSDEKDIPAPPTAENFETRYLRISIASNNDNAGRLEAKDFDAGTEAENKVNTLDFYFYDAKKNYVSYVHVDKTNDAAVAGSPDYVDRIITSVVPIKLTQGATIPNYVIVAVNAVNPTLHMNKSMVDAQSDILNSIYENGGKGTGFGMSNSVYYGHDIVSNVHNTLIMATPFDSGILKTKTEMDKLVGDANRPEATEAEKKALTDATVDCYVERYASKITLNGTDKAEEISVSDYAADGGITLRFVPEGWAFNNFEKGFYFIKSYCQKTDNNTPGDFGSLEQINNVLKWGWNDETRHRSYWTRTPGYFSQNYPVVADDILDNIKGTYTPDAANIEGYPYNTFYQTYNHFSKNGKKAIGDAGYFSESTIGGDVITGKNMPAQHNPLAAIPSVIVVGHYDISVGGTTVKVNDDSPTFYTYGTNNDKIIVYTAETDKGGAEIGSAKSLLRHMLAIQKVIYYKDTDSSEPVYDLTSVAGLDKEFSIEHPAKESRKNLKIASRIVTLQHGATNNPKLFFHDPEEPAADKPLNSTDNIAKANRLLFETLGGASAYHHGRAFFSAPVQHLGWQRYGNANKGKSQSEWDWSKMQAGDFGVVRNHKYTLSVNGISGLGTGILDYDNPIVPPAENVTYNMHFSVRIQKWAILPVQKIDW